MLDQTTTATTSRFAPPSAPQADLAQLQALAAAEGLDPTRTAELITFARANGVPLDGLVEVGSQRAYQGHAKLEAMIAYAIIHDAAHNGRVPDATAAQFSQAVLPAFEAGRVGVRLAALDGEHAIYQGHNDGMSTPSTLRSAELAGGTLERNTMYVGRPGIAIDDQNARARIAHEADHIFRDANRQARTILESEQAGNATYADYVLRAVGAITPTPDGLALDYDAFQAALPDRHNEAELYSLHVRLGETAQANADAGRPELNGIFEEEGTSVGEVIGTGNVYSSFEDTYVEMLIQEERLQVLMGLRQTVSTPEQVRRRLAQPAPADGL